MTAKHIEAFTSLPVFTEQYNDWWDSDRNGYWEGEVWVGARQPCMHDGEPFQAINDTLETTLRFEDLTGIGADTREAELALRPFFEGVATMMINQDRKSVV